MQIVYMFLSKVIRYIQMELKNKKKNQKIRRIKNLILLKTVKL